MKKHTVQDKEKGLTHFTDADNVPSDGLLVVAAGNGHRNSKIISWLTHGHASNYICVDRHSMQLQHNKPLEYLHSDIVSHV